MAASRLPIVVRNRYFLIGDLLLTAVSVVLAFVIRLDGSLFLPYLPICLSFVALAVAVKPVIYHIFGLYRRFWRYASVQEMIAIAQATAVSSLVLAVLVLGLFLPQGWFERFPRSVLVIDWLLSLFFAGGIRFSVRFFGEYGASQGSRGRAVVRKKPRRVLVMGAGDAGARLVREMQTNPNLGFLALGLLDDNRSKVGMTIHGVPVRGSREDIPGLVRDHQIDEVLIAMPTALGPSIREIVNICQQAGVVCKTMPGMHEVISGQVSVKQVREVRIEDLLRRSPVEIDGSDAARLLSDSIVLVTGAGGSIGAELCRQVARHNPKELLLLGHGEDSIHRILFELRERNTELAVRPVIADIRDPYRLNDILGPYEPEIIFHTAAHKHVPLMEANVAEAVMNNIFGTLNLLQAAEANGVKRFVLVSSDKAVNPTSVMGATKRVAELLVHSSATHTGRPYVVVRFGNVLGSRGSVVPLFQRQIAAGGPVTVTHPEMQRYFMTIPEAVQLIIQAAVIGQSGGILILDMGEPVRVMDLATDLIRLSGLEPGRDIAITFTGPRRGEKLREELHASREEPQVTAHPKIRAVRGNNTWDPEVLGRHLEELRVLATNGNASRIIGKLQEIVPEYQPGVQVVLNPPQVPCD